MTTGQNSKKNSSRSENLILPLVRYHPSITTALIHDRKRQTTNETQKTIRAGTRNDWTRREKAVVVPRVRYHPSISHESGKTSANPGKMDKPELAEDVEDGLGPEGGARGEEESSADTRSKKKPKGPKKTAKNTRSGGGACKIGPVNGAKTEKATVAGDDSNKFSQVQPRKESKKKVKKARNVGSRATEEEPCGGDCEIESKDERKERTKVETKALTTARSDGNDVEGAAGDSAQKQARKKSIISKYSNQNSRNNKESASADSGGADGLDPVLLEPRPGSCLDPGLVDQVEVQTRGQRTNPNWFRFRQNRITASVAHSIARSGFVNGKSTTPPASYVKAVLGEGRRVETRAMSWGIEHESEAVHKYQEQQSTALGRPLLVLDCGLFIDPARPWLAASPDGIVTDERTGQWLRCLEVKCPYKHRENSVLRAARDDKSFCLETSGQQGAQQFSLKRNHQYFTQVQCQLAVTGLKMADFAVFTRREMVVVQVDFDPDFWDKTVSKLERFYSKAVIPALRERNPA
ncbi:uncharacterized protein [Eucyclogobius newberryi]|uniref:uncharacterized protein n=1 Tax=Eucyclogobius newberryi TaxID=166745 RepID=UPI003B5CD8C7